MTIHFATRAAFVTLALLLGRPVGAEVLYVSQSGAGRGDGAGCANAWSLARLNMPSSWAVGSGAVSPGDTVRLCGDISGQVSILGSGGPSNPITLSSEPGARFVATHWTSPAIRAPQNTSFIRITGITITATASGSGQNAGTANGIEFDGSCDNCEIDNIVISKLFVRISQSRDRAQPNGIIVNRLDLAAGMDNLVIRDSQFSDVLRGVFVIYPSGSSSNYRITNNSCLRVGSCIWLGSGNSNRTLTDVSIQGNRVEDLSSWSGCFDVGCPGDNWHHCDGLLHAYAAHQSTRIAGLTVFDNSMLGASCQTTEAPSPATTTSWLFVEGIGGGRIDAPLIYNNVIAAGGTADGQIYLKGTVGARVYNNTIVSTSNTTSIGCLSSSITIRNNIAVQVGGTPTFNEGGCTGTSSFNNFRGHSWHAWLGAGNNGSTADAALNQSFRLTPSSPGRDTGVDLSVECSGCTKDADGTPRPPGLPWDMGAFQYRPASPPTPPQNLRTTPQ